MRSYRCDRVLARELIESGLSNLEIADRLGVKSNYVPDLKRQLGFEVKGFRKGTGYRATGQKRDRSQLGKRADYQPVKLRIAAAQQDDLFSSQLATAMAAQQSAKTARSEPLPKGKRIENGGGIRIAMLSRATDALREPSFAGFPTLKHGAHPAALAGSAELVARRRAEQETRLPETDNRERAPDVPLPAVDSGVSAGEFRAVARAGGCLWITGAMRLHWADTAETCGDERAPGSPYCACHAARARTKTTPKWDGTGADLKWTSPWLPEAKVRAEAEEGR